MQTYIILSDKEGLGLDVSMWDRHSNTLGIVLVSCRVKAGNVIPLSMYPRWCQNGGVIHVLADVLIPKDFKELPLKCLTKFISADSYKLYIHISEALKLLKIMSIGDTRIIPYAGRAGAELERMLYRVKYPVDLLSDDEKETHPELRADTILRLNEVLVPRQLVGNYVEHRDVREQGDHIGQADVREPWGEVSTWA